MSTDRHRIDRDSAERMLGAASAGPPADADPLAALLAAASAAGRGDELAGEDAAVAAFRDAVRPPEPAGERSLHTLAARVPSSGFPLSRLFSAKVAAVAMAATAAGGIALASATDTFPLSLSPGPKDRPSIQATSGPSAPPRGAQTAAPGPVPAPATVRLCHSYSTSSRTDPGKAKRDPSFAPLMRASGGPGKVADYCNRVLATAPSPLPQGRHGPAPSKGPGNDHKPGKRPKHSKPPQPKKSGKPPGYSGDGPGNGHGDEGGKGGGQPKGPSASPRPGRPHGP